MVEIAIPFNHRTVQFAQRRQHLVNHGLQRDVNHSRQTPHHYFRLTQNIKRIPTRFCHDFRVTRHKAGRGRVSRRQCEVADAPGRAVLYGSTLPACLCGSLPACAVLCRRRGCRGRTSWRTRCQDLRQRRHGDSTEKQQSRDCHSHAGRLAPSAPKNQGRWL